MRRARLVVLGTLLVAAPIRAQNPAARYCSSVVFDEDRDPQDQGNLARMHPAVARGRSASAVRDGAWERALVALRADAEAAFAEGKVTVPHQATFLAQLDTVLAALPQLPPLGDARRGPFLNDQVRTVRFHPRARADGTYALFRGSSTLATPDLTESETKALCWSALSVDVVLNRLNAPIEVETLARLGRLNAAWANYRTYGYTRQPLELFLWPGSTRDSLPARGQWLLAHLSAGVELRTASLDSLAGSATAVVEAGRLWYRKNYTQYSGVSLVVAVTSGSTLGYGAMVHVMRGVRGGVLTRHTADGWRESAVVSTDLYGLLERSKKAVDDGFAAAAGRVLLPAMSP